MINKYISDYIILIVYGICWIVCLGPIPYFLINYSKEIKIYRQEYNQFHFQSAILEKHQERIGVAALYWAHMSRTLTDLAGMRALKGLNNFFQFSR